MNVRGYEKGFREGLEVAAKLNDIRAEEFEKESGSPEIDEWTSSVLLGEAARLRERSRAIRELAMKSVATGA